MKIGRLRRASGVRRLPHIESPGYRAIGLHNVNEIPQIAKLPQEDRDAIRVVAQLLPFRVNR